MKLHSKLVPQQVPLTQEQEGARQRMLAEPCPYCSDPKSFQRELSGEGRADHETGIARVGKFWARDDAGGMLVAVSYDHGDYWRVPIGGEHFIDRFKDFKLDILSFKAPYSAWGFASSGSLFLLTAAPADLAGSNKFPLNVARVSHNHSPVVVDAHTWFSHGTVLTVHHLPRQLSSADVTAMREALEFFRPETRGGPPKITEARLRAALAEAGADATQLDVARRLKVTEQGLIKWRAKRGLKSWQEVLSRYAD